MLDTVPYRVLLPPEIWAIKTTQDQSVFRSALTHYMRRYPDYIVKNTKDGFAICERRARV